MRRINTPDGNWQAGDPSTGIKGTIVTRDYMQSLQEELAAVPESVGIALNPNDNQQLLKGIRKIYADGIASGIQTGGRLNGANSPNLLFNGSGEFGTAGWAMAPGPAFSQQVDQTGGIGTFFANTAAMTNAGGYIGSPLAQVGPNVAVTYSVDVANFATAGSLVLTLAAYNASGGFISNVASQTVANGTPLQRYALTGTTPAGTSNVQAYWTYVGISASAFGIVIRRIKIEQGSLPSLYSQEASITALGSGIPVVGTALNVAMNVASASATATLTADEIFVGAALGGIGYKLANFIQTINLTKTGEGGMDTGNAPVNGFVALYVIYNPVARKAALLARNATSTRAAEIYDGANMPAGYSASTLVSVWPTDGNAQFSIGNQFDRRIEIPFKQVLSSSVNQPSATPLSLSSVVPRNAKYVSGSQTCGSSTSAAITVNVSSSVNRVGEQGVSGTSTSLGASYSGIQLATQQTIYYVANASTGTPSFQIYVSGYEF